MQMRLFTCGAVLGLVLGLAATSFAAYIGTERWGRSANGDSFHLGYVAGIVDTVEALKGVSFASRQRIAEALDAATRCTASVTLGNLTARAENAVSNGPSTLNAADRILGDFVKCQ